MQRAITDAYRRRDWTTHREALTNALAWYRTNAQVLADKRAADQR
jgi:hypothetical protein